MTRRARLSLERSQLLRRAALGLFEGAVGELVEGQVEAAEDERLGEVWGPSHGVSRARGRHRTDGRREGGRELEHLKIQKEGETHPRDNKHYAQQAKFNFN